MLLRAIIFEHVIVKKGRPAVTASIIVIVTVYVAAPVPSSSPFSLGPLPLGRPTFAPLTGPPPAFFDFISVEKEKKEERGANPAADSSAVKPARNKDRPGYRARGHFSSVHLVVLLRAFFIPII